MNASAAKPAVPWHYWLVALVSLLWNAFGATDYFMTRTHNAGWMATMKVNPDLLAKVDAAPIWGAAGWAVGVWGSLLGSLLLLARSRHSANAFALSFFGAAVGFLWQMQAGIMKSPALPGMILLIVVLLWWHSRRAAAKGWLG